MANDPATLVFDPIGPLADVYEQHGMATEEDYECIFGGEIEAGIDNNRERPEGHMHLNDMATNWQRSVILNHPAWLVELAERRRKRKSRKHVALRQQHPLLQTLEEYKVSPPLCVAIQLVVLPGQMQSVDATRLAKVQC